MMRDNPRALLAGWIAGFASCALVGGIVAGLIIFGGLYNTAADSPHLKVVSWAVHRTMIQSVRRRADPAKPGPAPSRSALLSGAREYRAHCIACHGGPGVPRARWTRALLPPPPYLIDARTRWSHAELRTLIAHGVKMTAMPAWGEVLPAQKIDDLVDFVEFLPRLSTAQFKDIGDAARVRPAGAPAGSNGHQQRDSL